MKYFAQNEKIRFEYVDISLCYVSYVFIATFLTHLFYHKIIFKYLVLSYFLLYPKTNIFSLSGDFNILLENLKSMVNERYYKYLLLTLKYLHFL